jgi:signal transduction histidine kinase/ligand-binding sensor domain-containing protein/DNA-binding response OmpR family regulator
MPRIYSIIVGFFLFASSFAQVDQVISHLESSDEMSNNIIQCMCRDREGYLWVGTRNGLFRFDGYHFLPFINDPSDSSTITGNNVTSIVEDDSGTIWAGTNKGLNRFVRNTQQFQHFFNNPATKNSLPDNNIHQILKDHTGTLWLGTAKGLCQMDKKNHTFVHYAHNADDNTSILMNEVTCLYEDHRQNLWIATWATGLNQYNREKNSFTHYTQADGLQGYISCMAEDDKGDLWIGSFYNGLCKFDLQNKKFTYLRPDIFLQNHITSICRDRKGSLWITVLTKGLVKLDPKTEEITLYNDLFPKNNKLSSINNFSLYFDYQDILWIGSVDKGIDVIYNYPRNSTLLQVSEIVKKDLYITDIICDKQDNLWIKSGEMIIRLDKKSGMKKCDVYPSNKYNFIYKDREGQIWNYKNGCFRFNETANSFEPASFIPSCKQLNGTFIQRLYETKTLNRWIITDKQIVEYNNSTKTTADLTSQFMYNGINPANINLIFEDSKGYTWISVPELILFNDKTKKFTKVNKDLQVNDIIEDKEGKIWFSTSNGIYYFNHATKLFSYYSMKLSYAYSMWFDQKNNLWVSSQKEVKKYESGTQRVQKINLDKILGSWHYYSLAGASDGTLYIAGGKDILALNADSFYNTYIPSIVLTRLLLFNNEVLMDKNSFLKEHINFIKEITFTYKQSDISFEFSALNLLLPDNNKYSYKLEGYDNEWHPLSKNRTANYLKLPPGRYLLKIKGTNNDGIWSKQVKTIAITILPPWWKTWWFRALTGIAIILSIMGFIRYRTQKVIQKNIILEKTVKERTKEIEEQKRELEQQADYLQEINIELKERQDELEALTTELKTQSEQLFDANKNLQKLNATKDKFFSIIAHDLKNPFQAILSSADTLAKKYEQLADDKRKDHINTIKESSTGAYNLLENLLNWARTQTNAIEISTERVNIAELIHNTVQLYKVNAENKTITVVSDVPEKTFAFVDKNMLTTIVRNIFSNAIKYTYPGGKVEISAFEDKDETQISISDNGVGMDAKSLENIFHVTTHRSASGTLGESGTGLGLIICKEFIEKNNGSIVASSQPGIGTTFTLSLPVKEVSSVQAKEHKPETSTLKSSEEVTYYSSNVVEKNSVDEEVKGSRVLIVDDNPNIRENLKQFLSEYFDVYEAADGKEGLSIAYEMVPDIIISDVMMPEPDGYELCEKIKTDERTSHIPVILLTVRSSDTSRIKGIETGADDYVTKPFNMEYMLARIENLIRSRNELRKRFAKEITLEPKDITITSLDEKFLTKALDVVEKNMTNQEFDSNELVSAMGMSRSGLFLKLKALTGQSATEFIRTIRLKRAAKILTQKAMNISEVCYSVGFKHPVYFSRSFSKQFGMSPSEYSDKMSSES